MSSLQPFKSEIQTEEQLDRLDVISLLSQTGFFELAEKIFCHLDDESLVQSQLVCRQWHEVLSSDLIWQKSLKFNVRTNNLWRKLASRRGWTEDIFNIKPNKNLIQENFRSLYLSTKLDLQKLEDNWRFENYRTEIITVSGEPREHVICLQYDDEKIVGGLKIGEIRIWDRKSLLCVKSFQGHHGAVSCLQYDENILITGSEDSTVNVWDLSNGDLLNTLTYHEKFVFDLFFDKCILVISSLDCTVSIWDIISPVNINLRHVLKGRPSPARLTRFDQGFLVTASFDRTISVWSTSTYELVKSLRPSFELTATHFPFKVLRAVEYQYPLVFTILYPTNIIELWDIETGTCLKELVAHEANVTCIRFEGSKLVSGGQDGTVKVWNVKPDFANNLSSPTIELGLETGQGHSGRIYSIQFDEFSLVSACEDGTIVIRDFFPDANHK